MVCGLCRKLVDEQEPAMRQHRGRSDIHALTTVSSRQASATYVSSTCRVENSNRAENRNVGNEIRSLRGTRAHPRFRRRARRHMRAWRTRTRLNPCCKAPDDILSTVKG